MLWFDPRKPEAQMLRTPFLVAPLQVDIPNQRSQK